MNARSLSILPLLAFVLLGAAEPAQQPAVASDKPATTKPANTTTPPASVPSKATDIKAFGDWTVRCFAVQSPSPCDMFQLLTQRTTGQRVMSLSIAYMPKSDQHVMQIVLPLGVALEKGARLSAGAYRSPMLEVRRCNRTGCFVEGLIANDAIAAIANGSASTNVASGAAAANGGAPASVTVVSSDGHPLEIKFSLRGFAEARDAMAALNRQKIGGKN